MARLALVRRLLSELDKHAASVVLLEEETLLALYAENRLEGDRSDDLALFAEQWRELLFDVYAQRFLDEDRVLVAVYGEDQHHARDLAHAYFGLARKRGLRCELHVLTTHDPDRDFNDPRIRQLRKSVEQPGGSTKETVIDALRIETQPFNEPNDATGAIGLALAINGRLAYPIFEPERGLHVFRHANQTHKCLVDIGDGRLEQYAPPPNIDRRGAIATQPLRRTYDMANETADDERLGKRLQAPARGLDALIAFLTEAWLQKDAESLLDG